MNAIEKAYTVELVNMYRVHKTKKVRESVIQITTQKLIPSAKPKDSGLITETVRMQSSYAIF